MVITISGQRFDLRFEENVTLVPYVVAKALQPSTPTRDRSPQSGNPSSLLARSA